MAKPVRKNNLGLFAIFLTIFALGVGVLKFSLKAMCANSISCDKSLELKVENGAIAKFAGQVLEAPNINLAEETSNVLGEATLSGEKHIKVDLSTQTLTAYQGDVEMFSTLVSTGKWFETPTGDFKIWLKVRSTRMTGGEGADFYDLPNVPYVMFFYNDQISKARGFGFHGAYWHNNFGHPMSHGCVNLRAIDAQKLYEWADIDTSVTITGVAP